MKVGGEKRRADAYTTLETLLRDFNELQYGAECSASKFALGTGAPTVLDVMLAVVVHYAAHPR